MKNIFKIVGMLFLMIWIILLSGIFAISLTTKEEKPINCASKSRVLIEEDSAVFYSNEERELLEKQLLDNKNVLILFTDKVLNKDKANSILNIYSDKEIPYVIFMYDNDSKTLSSLSNDLVKFDNIELKGVSYMAIYKYLPSISSTVIVNSITLTSVVLIDILIIIALSLFISAFVSTFGELIESLSWKKDINGIMYKTDFLDRNIKIKFDFEEQDDSKMATKIIFNGIKKNNMGYIPLNKYDYRAIKIEYQSGDILYYKWDDWRNIIHGKDRFNAVYITYEKQMIDNTIHDQVLLNLNSVGFNQ